MYRNLSDLERRIVGEVYSSSAAMDNLRVLCDDFGGRFAGTSENKAAAEFILSKFEEYGFGESHLESFNFRGCEVGPSKLEIIKPIQKNIPCLTLPMTASGDVEAEVVYVEADSNWNSDELNDKVILGPIRLPSIRGKETGVAGFVWMHPYPTMGPPTGCIHSTVPSVSIKHEDGLLLRRLVKRHGFVKVRLEAECEILEKKSWNVCGVIPGRGKSKEYVLFGGHYDGHEIAQAAFDCGSGCMAITEMGRILCEYRDEIERSLKIVCFSAEEFGFWGSKDYTKRHMKEMDELLFTYQLDCCGGNEPQMVTTDFWPQLEPFYEKLAYDLNTCIPHDQRMGPGDSRPFFELGIPTGSILDYRLPGRLELLKTFRHTVYDTVDKIRVGSLRKAVVIGAISGLRMLNTDVLPEHRTKKDVEAIKKRTA